MSESPAQQVYTSRADSSGLHASYVTTKGTDSEEESWSEAGERGRTEEFKMKRAGV